MVPIRYAQQLGAQHSRAAGFRARMKALMNFPSTASAMASTSTPFPERNSRASSTLVDSCRLDVDCLEARRRQLGAIIVFVERSGDAADPEQHVAAYLPAAPSPRVTTSETAKRPPGFNTRKASCNTRSLSPDRLITQFEMITSTVLSGSGIASISPFKNSTFSRSGLALVFARQRKHLVGHIEAVGLSRGPTRRADKSTSMPPPDPRSSTVSPGFNSARAVGLPQPSDAAPRHPAIRQTDLGVEVSR